MKKMVLGKKRRRESLVRFCQAQLACDGAPLKDGRETCRRCQEVQRRRNLTKPLRGERWMQGREESARNCV